MLRLYSYFASSAAYRVRIALNLKGLRHETVFVSLLKDGGEQKKPDYMRLNPQGLVPTLETGEGALNQSLAILEYIDELYPEPPMLPDAPFARAQVRAFAFHIACDIHPLNNLRVRKYLRKELGHPDEIVAAWYRHWIELGFAALEQEISGGEGPFCFGKEPSLADVCLVPQMANARRFDVDVSPFPRLVGADAACRALQAFADAAPERQPDAPAA